MNVSGYLSIRNNIFNFTFYLNIAQNIRSLTDEIPSSVKLVAVSKTKPAEIILEAYNSGQKIFGENRVQELIEKHSILPGDIEWHMIGHLQSNKVKYFIHFVSLIHSVDSFKLLKVINVESEKQNRITKCLIQVHIASEESKFGFSEDEVCEMLDSAEFRKLHNVRICGLMGMASFTDDVFQVRREFKRLNSFFCDIRAKFFQTDESFKELSMGMSGDFKIAIEEGSTIVRLGSLIFGER